MGGLSGARTGYLVGRRHEAAGYERRDPVLWLIVGIVLLVVAIAGGAIIHPILFVLGILALFLAFSGWRSRTVV